ncbi:hypothetical protein V6N13_069606 [Hibiscus sabdariffa]
MVLLFNCNLTSPGMEEFAQYNVDCGSGNESNSNTTLALWNGDPMLSFVSGNCTKSVLAPVDFVDGVENVEDVVNREFVLNWIASDCSVCEGTGGICGFNYISGHFNCFCPDRPHSARCIPGPGKKGMRLKLGLGLAPKRYRYSDIKKIISSFQDKLGKGGYGDVYKGKLLDGRHVAVKILNKSKSNGEDFINEVASISRTSHVNIVTLLGFCIEGRHRALVYEFMPNGSLEKFIFREKTDHRRLEWEKLYRIAVGIARGLDYLHRGCNTRILHFDIKPHNILLDDEFCPKISDFGLARSCQGNESFISMTGARGTIGYIAPEVFSRNFGRVSHKSDVYSYGMMILEMVGGRKNINVEVDRTSEIYFPDYIYSRIELDGELGLEGIENEDELEKARKMIIVSLWCIQTDPSNRPSMSRVVEMLEGTVDSLTIPPKPFLSSSPSRAAAATTNCSSTLVF